MAAKWMDIESIGSYFESLPDLFAHVVHPIPRLPHLLGVTRVTPHPLGDEVIELLFSHFGREGFRGHFTIVCRREAKVN